jgi:hypothetical protein
MDFRAAAVFRQKGHDSRHIPADTVTGDSQGTHVPAKPRRQCRQTAQDGVTLLNGDREPSFGRKAVLWKDDDRVGSCGQLTDELVVGMQVAEDPSGAVQIEDHVRRTGDVVRPDEMHRNVTPTPGMD